MKVTQNQLIERAKEHSINATKTEKSAILQVRKAGYRYKFQHVFGYYILDIVIPELMLVIELDGDSHVNTALYDARRDKFCNECGLRVLRLKNGHVSLLGDKLKAYLPIQDYQKRFKRANEVALDKFNALNQVKMYRTLG